MKLFELILSGGTFIENVNKTVGANTNFSYFRGEKGFALRGTSGNTVIFTGAITGVKTILFGIKKGADSKIFLDDVTDKLEITIGNISGTGLTQNYVDNEDTDSVGSDKYHFIVAEFSAGINFSTNVKFAPSSLIYLAHRIVFYDSLLTERQRAKEFSSFLNASPKGLELYPRYGPGRKLTDLSHVNGLIAAYNMIPSAGSVLADISGSGRSGTIVGSLATLEGMRFNGVGDYVDLGFQNTLRTGDFTFLAGVKKSAAGAIQTIFSNRSSASSGYQFRIQNDEDIELSIGATSLASTLDAPLGNYFDLAFRRSGTDVEIFLDGVSIATGTNALSMANAVNDQIGRRWSTHYLKGEVSDARIYSRALSNQVIKDYHNQFAYRIRFIEDFRWDAVGSALPRGWTKGTGVYAVKELATADSVLKHLKVGTKYYENSSAGLVMVPNRLAFGTLEFDLFKGSDASQLDLYFINSARAIDDGYRFRFSSAEQAALFELTNAGSTALAFTAAAYITILTWYRIKITSTLDGERTMYIKGGAFGNAYQLIDVSGGSGTNPVTDLTNVASQQILLDFDVGDAIANIIWREGVEQ